MISQPSSQTYMPGLCMVAVQAYNVLPGGRCIQHYIRNTTRHSHNADVSVNHKEAMAHILQICLSAAKIMCTHLRHRDVVSPESINTDYMVPPTPQSKTTSLYPATWDACIRDCHTEPTNPVKVVRSMRTLHTAPTP
jgi:hypothetical protein